MSQHQYRALLSTPHLPRFAFRNPDKSQFSTTLPLSNLPAMPYQSHPPSHFHLDISRSSIHRDMPCTCERYKLCYSCGCRATNPDRISYACGNTRGPTGRRVFCDAAQTILDFTHDCCPKHHHRSHTWSINPNDLGQQATMGKPAPATSQAGPEARAPAMQAARTPAIHIAKLSDGSIAAPQPVLQPTPPQIPAAVPQVTMQGSPRASSSAIPRSAPPIGPLLGPQAGSHTRSQSRPRTRPVHRHSRWEDRK